GKSAVDNSFIVYNNSIVIENNYGWVAPFRNTYTPGGVVRVDVDPSTNTCKQIWSSSIIAPTSVPKLSLKNGILYFYTKDSTHRINRVNWSLTGLDFHTGKKVLHIPTGRRRKFNNN